MRMRPLGRLAQALATLKKRITSSFLFVVAAFSCAVPLARSQSTAPFVLSLVSGDTQRTGLNQVFPQRLVVRLTDDAGTPLAGAHIYFETYDCLSLLGSPCEFPGAPGHFQSGSGNATVTSDVNGLAVSPAYYAGGSLSTDPRVNDPGAIGVGAYVVPDEAPYYFSISATVTHGVVFFLSEAPTAQPPSAVPSLSGPALGILCGLFFLCGIWRLQRRAIR